MRLLCVPCPSNHNSNTLILLICEGITEFPMKIKTQAFLCPAELMESAVLKWISNGKSGLLTYPFFNKKDLDLKSVFHLISKHS